MGLRSTAYAVDNSHIHDLSFCISNLLMIFPSLSFFRAQPLCLGWTLRTTRQGEAQRETQTWKRKSEQMVCRDRKPFAYTFSTVFLTLTMLDLPTLINFALPISE